MKHRRCYGELFLIVIGQNYDFIIVMNDSKIGIPYREDGSRDPCYKARFSWYTGVEVENFSLYKTIVVKQDNKFYHYNNSSKTFEEFTPHGDDVYLLFEYLV